jgi:hypothetical protein
MISMPAMTSLVAFLAPGSLNHTANIIKGFAIAIGIAIAIGFVWMWWAARLRERKVELATRARAIHSSQLRSAIQYPELAEPMAGSFATPGELVRYRQYVASLLSSAGEILLLDPTEAWRATLSRQLAPHTAYLKSDEFRTSGLDDCTAEVQALVRRLTG